YSSRRRHTRSKRDWSSDVCSSDLVFSMFYLTKAVLSHLKPGSSIVNTSSITAYAGSKDLIDYSATKGAITSFTRSLSQSLVDKGIRVNAVAPGPIWTPLIPSTFDAKKVGVFGG